MIGIKTKQILIRDSYSDSITRVYEHRFLSRGKMRSIASERESEIKCENERQKKRGSEIPLKEE